jgi:hypothetical protein
MLFFFMFSSLLFSQNKPGVIKEASKKDSPPATALKVILTLKLPDG